MPAATKPNRATLSSTLSAPSAAAGKAARANFELRSGKRSENAAAAKATKITSEVRSVSCSNCLASSRVPASVVCQTPSKLTETPRAATSKSKRRANGVRGASSVRS